MKRMSIAALVVAAAVMAGCGNGTPKAELSTQVDTLSYAIGMAQSQGLREYLVRRLGVDTAYIDEFIKGLNDGVNAGDDKKKTAYYAGIQIGQQVSQQMIKGINFELFGEDSTQTISQHNFMAGFIGGTTGENTLMNFDEAQQVAMNLMQDVKKQQMEKQYGEWKKENEEWLANIAKKAGVKQLSDGVYYEVIEEGTGDVPADSNRVSVHYEGRLINDTIFDSSYKRGEPTNFVVNQVVRGWTEALTHMPVGSIWKVYISADKGYGERAAGEIKPFSTLVFKLELKDIVK